MFVHILVVCIYSLYSFMSFSFLSFLVNRVTRWNCVVSFYNDKWSILNINLKCEETTSSGWRDCLKPLQANTYNWLSVTESTCLHLLLRKAITTSDQIYKIMYKNFIKKMTRFNIFTSFGLLGSFFYFEKLCDNNMMLCKQVIFMQKYRKLQLADFFLQLYHKLL